MPTDLTYIDDLGGGQHRFRGSLTPTTSGRYGFAVRIVPGGEMMDGIVEPGLIAWDIEAPPAPEPKPAVAGSVA